MLRKFGFGARGPRPLRPGLWLRFCVCCGGRLWQMFALSSLLLFGYILCCPKPYLLIICFIQVIALMVWLQKGG